MDSDGAVMCGLHRPGGALLGAARVGSLAGICDAARLVSPGTPLDQLVLLLDRDGVLYRLPEVRQRGKRPAELISLQSDADGRVWKTLALCDGSRVVVHTVASVARSAAATRDNAVLWWTDLAGRASVDSPTTQPTTTTTTTTATWAPRLGLPSFQYARTCDRSSSASDNDPLELFHAVLESGYRLERLASDTSTCKLNQWLDLNPLRLERNTLRLLQRRIAKSREESGELWRANTKRVLQEVAHHVLAEGVSSQSALAWLRGLLEPAMVLRPNVVVHETVAAQQRLSASQSAQPALEPLLRKVQEVLQSYGVALDMATLEQHKDALADKLMTFIEEAVNAQVTALGLAVLRKKPGSVATLLRNDQVRMQFARAPGYKVLGTKLEKSMFRLAVECGDMSILRLLLEHVDAQEQEVGAQLEAAAEFAARERKDPRMVQLLRAAPLLQRVAQVRARWLQVSRGLFEPEVSAAALDFVRAELLRGSGDVAHLLALNQDVAGTTLLDALAQAGFPAPLLERCALLCQLRESPAGKRLVAELCCGVPDAERAEWNRLAGSAQDWVPKDAADAYFQGAAGQDTELAGDCALRRSVIRARLGMGPDEPWCSWAEFREGLRTVQRARAK